MTNDRGFQSILRPGRTDEDRILEDQLLEDLAAKKGIGRLQSPGETARTGASRTAAAASLPPTATLAAPAAPAAPQTPAPTPRSRVRSMNLELPDYVMRALKEMALRDDCSVRHVIMRALAREGILIQPADMIADGRRLRGKNVQM